MSLDENFFVSEGDDIALGISDNTKSEHLTLLGITDDTKSEHPSPKEHVGKYMLLTPDFFTVSDKGASGKDPRTP
eukprot:1245573-Ditylum_brightwellii.AAC.1